MGDLSSIIASRDAYKEKYSAVYPDAKRVQLLQVPECCTDSFMRYRKVTMLYSPLRLTVRSILELLKALISMRILQRYIPIAEK